MELPNILSNIDKELPKSRIAYCNRASQMTVCLLSLLLSEQDIIFNGQQITDVFLVDGVVGIPTNLPKKNQWVKVMFSNRSGMLYNNLLILTTIKL